MAAVTALGLCVFIGPWFIRRLYALKLGQSIRKDHVPLLAELHEKKQDTPTMGGVLILSAMLLSLVLWMDLTHAFTGILLLSTVWLGAIGACDDYLKIRERNSKGLPGRWKLVGQAGLVAVLSLYLLNPAVTEFFHQGQWFTPPVAKEQVREVNDTDGSRGTVEVTLSTQEFASRIYIPFYKKPLVTATGLGLVLMGVFYFFVIAGCSNAVNLTDGLDGLAAGCLVMVAMTFGVIAFVSNHIDIAHYLHIPYIDGAVEIAVYLSAFAGACLGFLWYNGHPAQVFMGDTGSLCLGGILGVVAVLLKREALLAVVGGIFVAEALSVIIQVASVRLRNRKRVFLCAPLHHHFEYKGWPETKVVVRFWIVGLLLALIGLGSLKLQ